ncbi:MAG: GspE/PulE family protein [Armatimonadota bacterium]
MTKPEKTAKFKLINEELSRLKRVLEASESTVNQNVVSDLITVAALSGVSDIHLEPMRDNLLIRFRLDGTLYNVFTVPKNKEHNIMSCIKIMSNMNIAEKRLPQDGRFEIKLKNTGDLIKVRSATMNQVFGEKIVIRIFGQSVDLFNFDSLGFSPENKQKFEKLITKKSGLVIVCGPTNSGKSTTLYAAMNKIKKPEFNIVSVEDPVEYIVDDINQIQVNPFINFDYATVLRGVLRQDPDAIFVGEIRDLETAQIAVRAALTGHLILTTFHATRSTTCITRLIDMGILPFLVAASINGIIVQRLARRICSNCIEEIKDEPNELLGEAPHYRGRGCPACHNTGYRGRIALHEIMEISGNIRNLIQHRAESIAIFKQARYDGLKTIQEDALEKVKAGIITLHEAVSLTGD